MDTDANFMSKHYLHVSSGSRMHIPGRILKKINVLQPMIKHCCDLYWSGFNTEDPEKLIYNKQAMIKLPWYVKQRLLDLRGFSFVFTFECLACV